MPQPDPKPNLSARGDALRSVVDAIKPLDRDAQIATLAAVGVLLGAENAIAVAMGFVGKEVYSDD